MNAAFQRAQEDAASGKFLLRLLTLPQKMATPLPRHRRREACHGLLARQASGHTIPNNLV